MTSTRLSTLLSTLLCVGLAAPVSAQQIESGEAAPATEVQAPATPSTSDMPAETTPVPSTVEPKRGIADNALPTPKPPAAKPRLMVLNLIDKGAGPALAKTLSDVVAGQSLRSYRGEVVTTQQVKLALDAAALQQMAGCDDDKCFLDIAEATQAARVIGGSVSKVGEDLLITLRVVERATGLLVREESRKTPIVEDLYYYAAQQLTSLVLTGKSTDNRVPVRIESDKGGAQVIIDGQAQGNAPVEAKLDPGTHEVIVQKADFVEWRTQITVEELTPQAVRATLIKDRGSLWPLSITLSTIGVVVLGGAVTLHEFSQNRYDGTHAFSFLEGDGYFNGPGESYLGKTPATSEELQGLQQSSQLSRVVAMSSYLLGGALLTGGVAVGVTELFVGE